MHSAHIELVLMLFALEFFSMTRYKIKFHLISKRRYLYMPKVLFGTDQKVRAMLIKRNDFERSLFAFELLLMSHSWYLNGVRLGGHFSKIRRHWYGRVTQFVGMSELEAGTEETSLNKLSEAVEWMRERKRRGAWPSHETFCKSSWSRIEEDVHMVGTGKVSSWTETLFPGMVSGKGL